MKYQYFIIFLKATIAIVQYFEKVTFNFQPELPWAPPLAHREAEELGG